MGNASKLFDLEGKVAVITGAAGGLGSAMARGLSSVGVKVLAADIKEPRSSLGNNVVFRLTDVSLKDQVDALVDDAVARFGRLDIMVANAATGGGATADNETVDGWDQVQAVNARGVFLCDQAASRKMITQGGGSIINTASVLSFIGSPCALAYSASKGAVIQLTRTLAIEWARYNIRVNAIAPGFFRTPLNQSFLDSEVYMKPIIDKIPLGRIGEPDEIVGIVIYLASEASRFMTGSVLVIDGGEMAAGGYTEGCFPFIYKMA